jgi:nucleoside-diphosphate-sugar epimerase
VERVLVTGGTGAIGQAVAARLQKMWTGEIYLAGGQEQPGPREHLRCDIRDRQQLADAFDAARPDLVLHLAGIFSGTLEELYASNVAPSRQLLELALNAGRRVRVVLIGSAAEYGVVRPEENPVAETRVLAPVSAYGVSKAWQTQLLGLYCAQGVDALCARIFNIHGPGVSTRLFPGRLQQQIDDVLAGKQHTIEVGPLAAVRDYISTDMAAEQLLAIAQLGETGAVYHVASGSPVSMSDFLQQRIELHGIARSVVREGPGFSNRSGYDVPVIYADMGKTRQLLERVSHG